MSPLRSACSSMKAAKVLGRKVRAEMTGTRVGVGQEGGVGRGQGAGREVGAGGGTPGRVPGADLAREGGPGLVQEGEGVEAGLGLREGGATGTRVLCRCAREAGAEIGETIGKMRRRKRKR